MITFRTSKPELAVTMDGAGKVTFRTPSGKLKLLDALRKDKEYVVELKEYRDKRSLNANAYFWLLVGSIAEKVNSTSDEIYLELLKRYGVFTFLVVKKSQAERIKNEWRIAEDLGEVTVNGNTGVQLKCYFGSSGYDTKEMSRLIEGTVEEAKALGIDTRTPEEIALMTSEWGR